MRIIVVRHGLAEPKKRWAGPDGDRPLVARGRRQADQLIKIIGADRPARVISSPALRCVQTVEPLANRYGLTVEISGHLSTRASDAAMDLYRQLLSSEPTDSTVLLCTHREVLVELLPGQSKVFNRNLGHRPPGAKGGAWILRYRQGRLTRVDYRPPRV